MEDNQHIPGQEQTAAKPVSGEGAGSPKRPKFPTAGDILAMLGIFFAAQVVGMLVTLVLGGSAFRSGEPLPPETLGRMLGVSSLVIYVLALGGMLVYRRARGGRGPVARFSIRGLNPALLLWGMVFLLAANVVLEPLLRLLPPPSMQHFGSGGWTILALVVFAPVFEELICRGVVLGSLRAKYGVVVAWLVSSLFFGVLHLQPQMAVNAFFIGLIFAYLYIRTDSLWIAMILHAFNNAAAYLMIRTGYESFLLSDAIGSRTAYVLVYIAAAAICAVSGVMIYRTLKSLGGSAKKGAAA